MSNPAAGDESEIGSQLELIIRRGLAESVAKRRRGCLSWVFTSGNGTSPLERVVGRTMQCGRNEFPVTQFTCIGIAAWEELAEKKRMAKLANGMVHEYGIASTTAPLADATADTLTTATTVDVPTPRDGRSSGQLSASKLAACFACSLRPDRLFKMLTTLTVRQECV